MPARAAEWRLTYVRAEDVDRYWGGLRPFIEKAIERAPSNLTPDDVREWASDERARIWLVEGQNIAAAFSVREWPDGTVEFLTFSGSHMSEWLAPLFREFCDMAKRNGRTRLRMGGRAGWRRWLARLGFVFCGADGDRVLMEKVL